MPGYNYDTWYRKNEIAYIISLKNMIRQYRVTYDSNNQTLIVHREASALPDIEVRMHKSGLHMFYPEDVNNLVLMNMDEENMKAFTISDIEGAEAARNM